MFNLSAAQGRACPHFAEIIVIVVWWFGVVTQTVNTILRACVYNRIAGLLEKIYHQGQTPWLILSHHLRADFYIQGSDPFVSLSHHLRVT